MKECECEEAGFCLQYNREMSELQVRICREEVLTPERCQYHKKNWLKNRPTLIGDVVHKVAQATGIAKVVKLVSRLTGKPCGCKKRQKEMNKIHARRLQKEWRDEGNKLLKETEILVKSFRRQRLLLRFLESVRKFYPEIIVHVVDDSGEMTEEGFKARDLPNVIWHEMPFDSGLPAGRNKGIQESSAKYVIICEEDFVFTKETDLGAMLIPLETLDICGGLTRKNGVAENWCGNMRLEGETLRQEKANCSEEEVKGVPFQRADFTYNFFAAKRETLLAHPWDERYKISDEHLDSFLTWKKAGLKVGFTTQSICDHAPSRDREYNEYRQRKDTSLLNEKWGISERKTISVTKFPGI